jgi:hypothetical protein
MNGPPLDREIKGKTISLSSADRRVNREIDSSADNLEIATYTMVMNTYLSV